MSNIDKYVLFNTSTHKVFKPRDDQLRLLQEVINLMNGEFSLGNGQYTLGKHVLFVENNDGHVDIGIVENNIKKYFIDFESDQRFDSYNTENGFIYLYDQNGRLIEEWPPVIKNNNRMSTQNLSQNSKLIPQEVILENMFETLELEDFLNLCQTEKGYQDICYDDQFWEKMYKKYYSHSGMDKVLNGRYYTIFMTTDKINSLIQKLNLNIDILTLYQSETLSLNPDSIGSITEIPKEIGQLINLRSLFIEEQYIKEIPNEIGLLIHLQDLGITSTLITTIPKSIGLLVNLEILWLTDNKIQELPDIFSRLTKLREVRLFGNQLKDIPPSLKKLKQNNPKLELYTK